MWFYNPVIFVRKIEEFAGNTESLQGIECRQSLRVYHAEIMGPVDDQHGRLPILDIIDGIMFFIASWVGPGRALVI